MNAITPTEERAAIEECLKTSRAELAQVREWLMLHRDVLISSKERVAELEASAIRAAQAVKHFEARKGQLEKQPQNGVVVEKV